MSYKIFINKADYSDWRLYIEDTEILVDNSNISFNPLKEKLFNGDILDQHFNLILSPIQDDNNIPGILLIGKTYGRSKNGAGKFYYKCIPNDKNIPAFLIPYEERNIGFHKNRTNQYILFKYSEWIDKHPIGVITSKIGAVNNLNSFYEYHLHCKDLVISIKEFTKNVNRIIKQSVDKAFISNIIQKNPNIENRLDHYVITIDPDKSTDLDDAISIRKNTLSIYIANVPLLIEEIGIWNLLSERVATIYLPDRKYSLLPTILSENLCSLLENESRLTFCIDICVEDNKITNVKFCNALVNVRKNYRYDSPELENDKDYEQILKISQLLCKNYKYIKEIRNSHDLVAYLMILMNIECANKMTEFKNGIYRNVTVNRDKKYDKISDEVSNFIKIWQSSSGKYSNYDNKKSHDLISDGIENYLHITSPIRRLVDILNMMRIQSNLNLIKMTNDAEAFYTTWINKLDYINISTQAIRKVQIDCEVLNLCINNPNILNQVYNGYIFDKVERPNNYLQYTVYIPSIKIITRVNVKENLQDYSCHKFKLYLIEDGMTLKRKIRAKIE